MVLAIKHVLVIAMIVLALGRSLALAPRGAAPSAPSAGPGATGSHKPSGAPVAREKASIVLLMLNAALGVAVIALSALAAALAGGAPR